MKKFKTINEVLRKGQNSVNVPVTIMLVVIPVSLIYISPLVFSEEYVDLVMIIGLIIGIVLAWLWWSYKIVKWRIWAFENTKKSDWIQLKQRAIIQGLIWSDGSIFEKTEIRSKSEKDKIAQINVEIDKIQESERDQGLSLDEIEDDPNIPSKLEYEYLRTETVSSLIVPVFLISMGIYLLIVDQLIFGILAIGFAVYRTDLDKIKNVWSKKIQFSISDDGMVMRRLKKFGLIKWQDTEDIIIDTENGILQFGVWKEDTFYEVTFNLNDYPIGDYDAFLRMMNVYMKRSLEKENDSEQSGERSYGR